MVEVTKLNLGQDSEARFGQEARGQRRFGTFSENSSVLLPSSVLKTSGLDLSSLWLADEMFDSSFFRCFIGHRKFVHRALCARPSASTSE